MVTGKKLINQTEKSAVKQSIQNEEDLHKFIKEKWMDKIKEQTRNSIKKKIYSSIKQMKYVKKFD